MIRRLSRATIPLLASGTAAVAAPLPSCLPPVEVAHAQVARSEQNGVLVLLDGRAVKVEGLLFPAGARDRAPASFQAQALAALKTLTQGRDVTLAAQPPKEDRYDRIRAQILFPLGDKEPWLQAALLRRGLARVFIAPDRRECAGELYAVEAQARTAHAGLWASPAYAVRTPMNLGPAQTGSFQIVEGQVQNADVKGGRAYLNFGADWRRDFTVTIAPQDLKSFSAAGIDPRSYSGKMVRVRGWVQYLNGPEIEIAAPESIEILSDTPLKPAMAQ
ncbi:MAG TPA: thermonuclease family protein [Rhizomicrobium sp.]|jgi:hypothetical protein